MVSSRNDVPLWVVTRWSRLHNEWCSRMDYYMYVMQRMKCIQGPSNCMWLSMIYVWPLHERWRMNTWHICRWRCYHLWWNMMTIVDMDKWRYGICDANEYTLFGEYIVSCMACTNYAMYMSCMDGWVRRRYIPFHLIHYRVYEELHTSLHDK